MFAFGLAWLLGLTVAALAQLQIERTPANRPAWQAALLSVALATLIDLTFDANILLVCATTAGAVYGVSVASCSNFTERPRHVALAGCAIGLAVMTSGFVHFIESPARFSLVRADLALAVFIGAMIFATSAIALGKLSGVVSFRVRAMPGDSIVKYAGISLCGWLGYAFVTETAQPSGLPALAAIGALACAIGVHSMTSRKCSNHPHCLMEQRRRGLLASIEWHVGDEPAWALRELMPQTVRSAADRKRRARSGWG